MFAQTPLQGLAATVVVSLNGVPLGPPVPAYVAPNGAVNAGGLSQAQLRALALRPVSGLQLSAQTTVFPVAPAAPPPPPPPAPSNRTGGSNGTSSPSAALPPPPPPPFPPPASFEALPSDWLPPQAR